MAWHIRRLESYELLESGGVDSQDDFAERASAESVLDDVVVQLDIAFVRDALLDLGSVQDSIVVVVLRRCLHAALSCREIGCRDGHARLIGAFRSGRRQLLECHAIVLFRRSS